MKTLEQLAQEALQVQDACNLSGVVKSMAKAMSDLWEHANSGNHGTTWVNTHPITRCWASKVAALSGINGDLSIEHEAFVWCENTVDVAKQATWAEFERAYSRVWSHARGVPAGEVTAMSRAWDAAKEAFGTAHAKERFWQFADTLTCRPSCDPDGE